MHFRNLQTNEQEGNQYHSLSIQKTIHCFEAGSGSDTCFYSIKSDAGQDQVEHCVVASFAFDKKSQSRVDLLLHII